MTLRLIIFLLVLMGTCTAQVQFLDIDLDNAISLAEKHDKKIFIETYTKYCQPCKLMDIEFKDPELARYMNKHFINVRVNMLSDRSKAFQNAYEVIFLPTMIFASAEGGQKMKIDRLVSSKELLSLAKHLNKDKDPKPAVVNNQPPPTSSTTKKTTESVVSKPVATTVATPVVKEKAVIVEEKVSEKPAPAPKVEDIVTTPSEGKILYVMGQDADNLPPAILKEEAYFRMQLMDGSHHSAARKYLDSQEDWSTEENIRFIHDFLNDARSEEFLFLTENRTAFDNILGKEQIGQTISILVNKELERGFPRPDYARAKTLYSYTASENADFSAACYHMNTLYESDKLEEFISYGKDHIKNKTVPAELLYRYSTTLAQNAKSKKALKNCLSLATRAADKAENEVQYAYHCAQLCNKLKDKKKASRYLTKAQALAGEDADMKQKLAELEAAIKIL